MRRYVGFFKALLVDAPITVMYNKYIAATKTL